MERNASVNGQHDVDCLSRALVHPLQYCRSKYHWTDKRDFFREYLPQLVPVEVPEPKAREWFRCLLSAVLFLHSRGVVHNDIKCVSFVSLMFTSLTTWPRRPANILLSTKRVPVLVDFGFAERYDQQSKKAFLSNLAYGTPEVCVTRFAVFRVIVIYSSETSSISRRNARAVTFTTRASQTSGLSELHSSRSSSAARPSNILKARSLRRRKSWRTTGVALFVLFLER